MEMEKQSRGVFLGILSSFQVAFSDFVAASIRKSFMVFVGFIWAKQITEMMSQHE